MTDQDRHNALDLLMAKYAMETRRLYSTSTTSELVEFAGTLRDDPAWTDTLAAFDDLVERARKVYPVSALTILDLMYWSYNQVIRARATA